MKTELIPGEAVFFQYHTPNTTITVLQRKNPSAEVVNGKAASNIKHLYRVVQSFPPGVTEGRCIELNSIYEKEYEKDTYIVVPWNNTSLINREQKIVGKGNLGRFIEILTDNIDKKPEEAWKLAADLYKYEKLQVTPVVSKPQTTENAAKPDSDYQIFLQVHNFDLNITVTVYQKNISTGNSVKYDYRIVVDNPNQSSTTPPLGLGSIEYSSVENTFIVSSSHALVPVMSVISITGKAKLELFIGALIEHINQGPIIAFAVAQQRIRVFTNPEPVLVSMTKNTITQKATVVKFHELKDDDQVIIIRGFSVQDYATMAREINDPVCSLEVLNWVWEDHAYIEDDRIKWRSKAKADLSDIVARHTEFCIKLEEVE